MLSARPLTPQPTAPVLSPRPLQSKVNLLKPCPDTHPGHRARLWPEAPWHKQCWPNTLPCLPRSSGDLKTDSEFTWEVTESCECSFKGVLPQVLCAALTLSTKVLSAPNQHLHFIPLLLQWSDCIPEYKPGTPRVTSPAGGRVWGTVSLQQPHLPSQVAVDAAIWKH